MKSRVLSMVTIVASGAILFAASSAGAPQVRESGEAALRAAMDKEVIDGDLKGAIEQYKQIAGGKDRALAAQALVRMADCYQKLGDPESRRLWEQVVREYGDQTEAATLARARLRAAARDTVSKRLLCTDCGEYEANTSPDGRWMVWQDHSGDIDLRDLVGEHTGRLMAKSGSIHDLPAYAEEPVLSPDLHQVAYQWVPDVGGPQVRVMANAPGAQGRVLLDSNPEDSYAYPVGWSPDGRSLLVLIDKRDHTDQLAWVSLADHAVTIIHSFGWRYEGDSTDAKISPDGRFIAYAARTVNPRSFQLAHTERQDVHIYVLSADGSRETEVVKTAGKNDSPVWSADGKHLAFLSDSSGSVRLQSIAIDNGTASGFPVPIGSGLADGLGDGRVWPLGTTTSGSYYYFLEQPGLERITVVDSGFRQQSAAEHIVGISPAWSPDGKFIAFTRHQRDSKKFELVVYRVETGDEKIFPTLAQGVSPRPVWFHDSKAILVGFDGAAGGSGGAIRVNAETGQYGEILKHRFDHPVLSGDDKTLYTERGGGVAAIDLASGTERPIRPAAADMLVHFALSPDSRTLALWLADLQANKISVATVGVDGSGFRELYTLEAGENGCGCGAVPAWTRNGDAILFAQQHGNMTQILRIRAQGGAPEFTGIETPDTIQTIAVDPSSPRIVYGSTTKAHSELWALDNVFERLK